MEQSRSTRESKKFSTSNGDFASLLVKGKGNDMARRRYQQGYLYERNGIWYGRYYESVLRPDGTEHRKRRNEPLGEFATEKLAWRAFEPILARINSQTCRPLRQANWAEFARQWSSTMLQNYKPSVRASNRSRLKTLAWFNKIKLGDLTTFHVQQFIAQSNRSPKTIVADIAVMRAMWKQAKAWSYVQHNPFEGLVLPREERQEEQPVYSVSETQAIIRCSPVQYRNVFRLLAETGIRRGEVCALDVGDVNLADRYITVRRSAYVKQLTKTKSRKPRIFPISDLLAKALHKQIEGRAKNEALFLAKRGRRLLPDKFVQWILKPILEQLGLNGACHAFRHGNVTEMWRQGTSPAIMQQRVGHADFDMTMRYMHVIDEDARAAVNALGRLYAVEDPDVESKIQ